MFAAGVVYGSLTRTPYRSERSMFYLPSRLKHDEVSQLTNCEFYRLTASKMY